MGETRFEIRPLDGNHPSIESVLSCADAEHAALDRWIHQADAVVGAVTEGRIVGVAARAHSRLHPLRDWVTVHVDPAYRRMGVGSELHKTLTAGSRRPAKVRIPSSQQAGLRFAAAHGYAHLVASGEVVLSEVPEPPSVDGEILEVQVEDAGFLDALGKLYAASHRWDPCERLDPAEVRSSFVGEDAIPETARVIRRGGDIVGVGIAYKGPSPYRVEMANFGAVDPEAVDAVEITHAVLHAVGRRLLDAGASIAVECDFGPGAHTALGAFLVRLVGRPATTVEILARPAA